MVVVKIRSQCTLNNSCVDTAASLLLTNACNVLKIAYIHSIDHKEFRNALQHRVCITECLTVRM